MCKYWLLHACGELLSPEPALWEISARYWLKTHWLQPSHFASAELFLPHVCLHPRSFSFVLLCCCGSATSPLASLGILYIPSLDVSHRQTYPLVFSVGTTFWKTIKRRIIYIPARASFLPLCDFHTPTSLFFFFGSLTFHLVALPGYL